MVAFSNLSKTTVGNAPKKPAKSVIAFIIKDVLLPGIVTYLLIGVIFNIVVISGDSMNPTFDDGDIIITNHLFYHANRGDVIVCFPESYRKRLIKRIVAVAGDTIDIDYPKGIVYLNGVVLNEPYIASPTYLDSGMSLPLTIPDGYYFAMGDNRNNSLDSRYPNIGLISEEEIAGTYLIKIFG